MEHSRKRGYTATIADNINTLSRSISPPTKRARPSKTQASPWKLTWVRDLPESENHDAVTLKDILGDPLISECWEFNYLHDVSFLMDAFDPDTRGLVSVHVVHGFWRQEDPNRQVISVRNIVACVLGCNTSQKATDTNVFSIGRRGEISKCQGTYSSDARDVRYASFQNDDPISPR